MKKLPEGWEVDILKNIIIKRKGKKPTILFETKKEIAIPYILIDQMEGRPNRYYTNDDKVPIADEDDILIVWDGSVGKVTSGIKGAIGSTIAALTPKKINSTLLKYFLITKKSEIENTSRGTSIQHINPEYFDNLLVPIPPKEIQQKIVEKLDKLMPKIRECRERLEKIPAIIKRYKQAVLNAAVTGKLTEDWRGENPKCTLKLNDYIKQIRYEKEKLYELKYQKVEKQNGRKSKRPISKYKKISIYENIFPKSWQILTIDDIMLTIVDCPHSTPKWTSDGKICLRTTNFRENYLDLSRTYFVSTETFNDRNKRLVPQAGDILYSREGGILGIACKITKEFEVCLGQRMMLFRTPNVVLEDFAMYFLNSGFIKNYITELIGGTASPHVNVGDIKQFPFPLFSFEEQNEIVKRVGELYNKADDIMEQYDKAKALVDKIDQSVLSKAFRGELV